MSHRRLPGVLCQPGGRLGAAAAHHYLVLAHERLHPFAKRCLSARLLQFILHLDVQAIDIRTLARYFGSFSGHLDFHGAHLLHELNFVLLQLSAFALQFFAEEGDHTPHAEE